MHIQKIQKDKKIDMKHNLETSIIQNEREMINLSRKRISFIRNKMNKLLLINMMNIKMKFMSILTQMNKNIKMNNTFTMMKHNNQMKMIIRRIELIRMNCKHNNWKIPILTSKCK